MAPSMVYQPLQESDHARLPPPSLGPTTQIPTMPTVRELSLGAAAAAKAFFTTEQPPRRVYATKPGLYPFHLYSRIFSLISMPGLLA